MELQVGSEFCGYKIIRELGKGGFGSVFYAEKIGASPENRDFRAAIKILHSIHAGDSKVVHRFHREAKLAKKLDHPNVIRIIENGTVEDLNYILMEFAEGKTLLDAARESMETPPESLCRDKTVSLDAETGKTLEEEATVTLSAKDLDLGETITVNTALPQTPAYETILSMMKQCGEVLAMANSLGLIHRDIKPENIMIQFDPQGQVRTKILDFGLAKNFLDQSIQLSVEGQALGTPAYMSPEQFKGETVDIRSDLYSLGCTFYTFVSRRKPFPGPTLKELMKQILEEMPERADQANPLVHRNVATMLEKLMQKEPSRRYQKPEDLIKDIDLCLKNKDVILSSKESKFSVIKRFFGK